MSERSVIQFTNRDSTCVSNQYPVTRGRSIDIEVPEHDRSQYGDTVKAILNTKGAISFTCVANTGIFLGHKVDIKETDAPLKEGWQEEGRRQRSP